MTIQQAFEVALQHHQAGRLTEAEALYRQILAAEPRHADALHYLGVIAHQSGRSDDAIRLIQQAISIAPHNSGAYDNLGIVLRKIGRSDEAIAAYRKAIALQPSAAGAHGNLANALLGAGQLDQAIAEYNQAILLKPDYAEAHGNLGNALKEKGCLDEAIVAYRKAITFKPGYAEAHCNLGAALRDKGLLDEAIAECQRAIFLKPQLSEAYNNLGAALTTCHKLDEASAACNKAIALRPDFAQAHFNLGIVLYEKGRMEEAMESYRKAIVLNPGYYEAHNNLGMTLNYMGRLDEAIAAYRQAVALKPDFPEPHNNLGLLQNVGRFDEAIASYRQAIALRPGFSKAHNNILFSLHYHPAWNAEAIAEEHRVWNRVHGEPLRQFIRPYANDGSPERRLRIGYVSPDFREHSVAFFLEGLLAEHDRTLVEVFCYSDVRNPDAVTTRMEQLAEQWRKITALDDARVADLIREDGIDILVDLAGHTASNRLLVFARKPAPVQVTWLGYPDTTGLETMDWRITDAHADPPGTTEALHSEQLVRLPRIFACFRPDENAPPAGPLPAVGKRRVTFASFHTRAKLNEPLLELWVRILSEVLGSRLMLVSVGLNERTGRETLENFFKKRGIAPARLEFHGRQNFDQYLALHGEVDVLLDSHPFSGHTVSCHALWMGVPVVTQAGRAHCSRMVASVLSNLGLPELIAHSPEEYVKLAVELANDLPRLAELRSTLRKRMEASPLMDAPRFARDIEAAYREMWRKWCAQALSSTPS